MNSFVKSSNLRCVFGSYFDWFPPPESSRWERCVEQKAFLRFHPIVYIYAMPSYHRSSAGPSIKRFAFPVNLRFGALEKQLVPSKPKRKR